MDERLRFVARLIDGEKMSDLCVEFDISRKTGYKIWNRYRDIGVDGLTDRSKRPFHYSNKLPIQIESLIVRLKKERPTWGARKIRELVARKYPELKTPAKSTVHAVLDRHGLVTKRRKRRNKATGTERRDSKSPNELWCADYKGEFRLGNRKYCYPLTITDHRSRYLLACEGLETTKMEFAFKVFERVFKEFGLPERIRSDNGAPFAGPNSLFNLTKLSVWWLRLGIQIERIQPGHPEQNGRHERMHRTLKKDAAKPAGLNFLQQQAKFDDFVEIFNNERPHEGLDMKFPRDIYKPSPRVYSGLSEPDYPFHDKIITVTNCGRICFKGKKVNFSIAFAGQAVGIKETENGVWLVSFMDYDLGYFDEESLGFEPLANPFGPRVLPMS